MADTKITLKEYIANPLGDATMSHRELYREMYSKKLDTMMEKRHQERIRCQLYYTKSDTYYIHFRIPSESVEDLYYDTVIYFYPNPDKPNGRTLSDHYVKFFSNDDTFNYVYTYTFNKKGLLIPDLKSKLSQYALKTPPNKTNPKGNIGYVKSIYLSYLLMEKYGYFNKVAFKSYGKQYTKINLLNEIVSYDDKSNEYKLRKESQKNKKLNNVKKSNDALQKARKIGPLASDNTVLIDKIPVIKTKTRIDKNNRIKNVKKISKLRKF